MIYPFAWWLGPNDQMGERNKKPIKFKTGEFTATAAAELPMRMRLKCVYPVQLQSKKNVLWRRGKWPGGNPVMRWGTRSRLLLELASESKWWLGAFWCVRRRGHRTRQRAAVSRQRNEERNRRLKVQMNRSFRIFASFPKLHSPLWLAHSTLVVHHRKMFGLNFREFQIPPSSPLSLSLAYHVIMEKGRKDFEMRIDAFKGENDRAENELKEKERRETEIICFQELFKTRRARGQTDKHTYTTPNKQTYIQIRQKLTCFWRIDL